MQYPFDFHIHSCLSPCGSPDMTPSNIARMAALAGCQIIAVSDHNTTGNCRSVMKAAKEAGITAIPAMELTTSEEVHVLCLLPDPDTADQFGAYVKKRMPSIQNKPEYFGEQILMDEDETILGEEPLLLAAAAAISIQDTPDLLRMFGGVAIPAHINRSSFSLISNLGFFDRSMRFPAVEVTRHCNLSELTSAHPGLAGLPYLINSDAHDLEAIPDAAYAIDLPAPTAQAVINAVYAGKLIGILK